MQLIKPIDLGQQLNSASAFKFIWLNWSIIGIYPPSYTKNHYLWRWLYYFYSAILNFVGAFCFPVSMLANLMFVESLEEIIGNLSLSVTVSFSTFKQLAIVIQRQRLLQANAYLQQLDLRCTTHMRDRMKILNAVRNCHCISLAYIMLYSFCCCGFGFTAWNNHTLYFNAYFPPFFANPETNYVASFIFQNITQIFTVFQNGTNDMYPSCYITLMIGHLDALADRIMRIGNDLKKQSVDKNVEELRQCIQDHKHVLSYFDCIRPVISATLFLQFCITAFVLCLTTINLIAFDRDFTQVFFAIVYLGIVLIQVFPCCWYVNVLMQKSDYLTTAMYSCNWMDQNQLFRKMLIIFMQRSQKSNIIMAGNLAPVTIQTFLVIIRFSFSMFTIFSKMKI